MTDAEKLARIRELIESYPRGSAFQQSGMQDIFRRVLDGDAQKSEPQTPGDKLADRMERIFWRLHPFGVTQVNLDEIRASIDEYRSTRNVRLVPDPKTLARDLIDVLTGGALSGLIAIVRDDRVSLGSPEDRENFNAHLRALGEDLP